MAYFADHQREKSDLCSSPKPDHAAYYAARANEYDISVGYGTPRVEADLAPLKASLRAALAGHDVLEIACGTGYWTLNVAQTANSIVAADADPTSIALARERLASIATVRCIVDDAYKLENIDGPFSAAFSMFWWSHMPKSKIRDFLNTLHARLVPGARVIFVDQLNYSHGERRHFDSEGNLIEERRLLAGGEFEIVKNFPTEAELAHVLAEFAQELDYSTCPEGRWWMMSYRTV
jgi:demethylmenaquinone methyltransferase/2-methoxy-6-polyprenyl-1,4-benzoquinol methylase